jgi:hypothetical protein
MDALWPCGGVGRHQREAVVQLLQSELAQQQLIPLQVRRALELWECVEVGLVESDGARGAGALFDQHQPSEPGPWLAVPEGLLAVGCPEILRGADGLLRAVVEVVAKRRPAL